MSSMKSGYGLSQWADWIEQDLLKKTEGTKFYHYTTISNCSNMLQYCKGQGSDHYLTLWASHFLFLNDSKEFSDGLEILKIELDGFAQGDYDEGIIGVCQKYRDIFSRPAELFVNEYPNHFILSFCNNGNLLSQWKYYGKNCGIAIEYDLENCLFDGYFTWDREKLGPHTAYRIIYDDEDKRIVIKKALDYLKTLSSDYEYETEKCIMRACALVSFMKSTHFAEEAESRLLFAPVYNDDKPISSDNDPMRIINYRETEGKIKPFLIIKLRHKNNDELPIRSITIGPGHNQRLIFNAIIMLVQTYFPFGSTDMKETSDIDNCNYVIVNGIKVRISNIPFRE